MYLELNKCLLREGVTVGNPCQNRLEIFITAHQYQNVLFSSVFPTHVRNYLWFCSAISRY